MNDKNYAFQKLTPFKNADISVYEDAINFVFDNPDVKNVAISGAYGAGKSSILESYEKKHSGRSFLHLSLAHFRPVEKHNDVEPVTESPPKTTTETVLEGKILNQLIHKIPPEKIPLTNFRVKKESSEKSNVLTAVLIMFSALLGLYVFFFHQWGSFVQSLTAKPLKCIIAISEHTESRFVAGVCFLIILGIFVYRLVKLQKSRHFIRKADVKGIEIVIFEDSTESYFDKYLAEVLYLFKNCNHNVIVFEDIDRFDSSVIFERLHEINTLVNNDRKDNPIRFFYLLRDDVFVSKDRTKFFDFIVPVVPVMDSSNSYEQFLKHLRDGNLLDKFDQSFLQSLSLYVDDMRILKNIYNELVVYIHRLNTTDLNWNKMMALIAYKNLFPRDFSDLQLTRGFVFELFEQKTFLIKEATRAARKQKQALLDRLEWAKKEALISQEELQDAYTQKISRLPKDYYHRMTPESENLKTQYEAELPIRKQAIQDLLDAKIPELEAELTGIERDIALTQTKPLKELITRENISDVFTASHTNEIGEINDFNEIKSSDYFDLLKFLVSRGYIDETYTDYLTYFYEDSISAGDKTFLRRITDRRGADYTYLLKEPKKIIESSVLRNVDFEQEETLNFDLFECLLINDSIPKYTIYLETLISQIKDTGNFDFISKFYDTGKGRVPFVIRINEQWSDFFRLVSQDKAIPSAQIRMYSIDTLHHSDVETINAVNSDNCLSDYIAESPDYLAIDKPHIERLIAGFSLIGVSFITIDYDKADKDLFHEIYQQSLYALSFENITLMLQKEYGVENESDIAHKNYSLIQSQANSPLDGYVSKNMAEYAKIILDNCDGSILDDETNAINLLNNPNVAAVVKKQYIELLSTTVSEFIQITDSALWAAMINRGIIPFSTSNFTNYFVKHGVDTALIKYINATTTESDFATVSDDFGAEVTEQLCDAVAICNDIATNKYRKILIDLGYVFTNYEADDISDEKFGVLIAEHILQMDTNSLEFVREKYAKHLLSFIQSNLNEYLALQSEEIFRLDEALEIITWDIDDNKKVELLAFTNEQISIVGKRYSDVVNSHILTRNFKTDDTLYLYQNYSQYGEQTQKNIVTFATEEIAAIVSKNMVLDDSLLSILLQSPSIRRDQKVSVFNMAIPNLNEDNCKTHFDELGLPELKGIFDKTGGRRNYEKSNDVTVILDALKQHSWIYDYRDDDRNTKKYLIIKNKPRSKELEVLD